MSVASKMVRDIKADAIYVHFHGLIGPIVGFGGIKISSCGVKGSRSYMDAYLYTDVPK